MIGKLKHRITIEQPSRTADTYGGYTETWTTLVTVWAKIEPTKGLDRFFAHKVEHITTHKITIRERDDITSKMRISFDQRYFYIKGIKRIDEANRWIELHCEEGVGA